MPPFPSPTSTWRDNTYPTLSPERPELTAAGKSVLITGGGTGIGAETARYFARAGASRIALLGRREEPLHETKESIHAAYPNVEIFVASTDVTKKEEVEKAFQQFLALGGNIDVLVSNAAVTGPIAPVGKVDGNEFVGAIEQNLRGSLNIAQAFLAHASADAVVIETSSSAAHLNFGSGFPSYSISKLAVFRLWDSVAFSNPELRVYHVQPGVVDTAMNREAGGVAAIGSEDHVSLPASFYVWLASPEARFLKSKFLWANWNVDELIAQAKSIEGSTRFNIGLVGWPFDDKGWKFQVARGTGAGVGSGFSMS